MRRNLPALRRELPQDGSLRMSRDPGPITVRKVRMRFSMTFLSALFASALAGAAHAQAPAGAAGPRGTEPVVTRMPDTTGNDRNLVIAPGPTGASTIQTDSAVAGNAGQPSRAVPQGGGGGSNR